ncbi:hypothetical protein Tco_1464147 [Tanacetum coccineum]
MLALNASKIFISQNAPEGPRRLRDIRATLTKIDTYPCKYGAIGATWTLVKICETRPGHLGHPEAFDESVEARSHGFTGLMKSKDGELSKDFRDRAKSEAMKF